MSAHIWQSFLGAEVRYIGAGGVRTRCIEAGDGPPVILLHGTGGHVEAWAHNLAPLAEHHRVIAIDMVGHGLSDKPDLEYVLTDYTAHVREVMAALGLRQARFAGISLGAWVATWLALESPELVHSLVNCTGGVFRWADGQEPAEARQRRTMVSASSEVLALTRDAVRRRLEILFHDPAHCSDELVDLRLELYSRPDAAAVLGAIHHMLAYDSPDRIKFSLTEERLAQIRVPVFYLWGEHNPGGSIGSATKAAALTERAELAVIAGAGHWPQWERPAEFNQLVIDYFARTAG
jgi:pimeloyl-ACP methyl ester carboxylesterase